MKTARENTSFTRRRSVGVSISIQGFICGTGNCVLESFHFITEEKGHYPLKKVNRKRDILPIPLEAKKC